MTPEEAHGLHEGDHVYLLAPQEKAAALDRFFADLPPPSSPDPQLLGDFFVGGDATLGALADIYGVTVEPDQQNVTVSDLFARRLGRAPHPGDSVRMGDVALVAHRVKDGKVVTVGLQLADEEVQAAVEAHGGVVAQARGLERHGAPPARWYRRTSPCRPRPRRYWRCVPD